MRLALVNLSRRGVRTGLSVLGVSVGVAAIVAFTAMGEGFKQSIDQYGEQSGADLVLLEEKAGDPTFGRILAEELVALRADPAVRSVAGSIAMPASMGERRAPVLVAGRHPGEELLKAYRNPALVGRLLEREGEAMVGELLAAELGLSVGQELELVRRRFTVVGIYRTSVSWENGGVVIHSDELREELTMPEGSVQVAFIYLHDPAEMPAMTVKLQLLFPHLRILPTALLASNFEQLAYIDSFIWVISVAALMVGAIGVLNTMLMSVAERTREIGTLRAFGWPAPWVLRLILTEGLLTSIGGGILGLGLGVVAAEVLMRWVPQGLLQPAFSAEVFVRGMLVALLLGALGAFYPAWRASRLSPAEALRYE